ncbi:MAG: hypothetical protein CVU97_02560 [Firmicutes bacterium HGW-Firmicutes-21]|nr:MAG: hypothetical protein CVU97_02560 [Firmicutes bacterium HGW-Firmicutes-21]
MPDWDFNLIGKYLLLFLTDGIFGYFLQFLGYSLAIHAFNKKRIQPKPFLLMTIIFSLLAFGIRKLPISFGYHTIIITIVCMIISYTLFKTSIYQTVLAVLLTVVSILIFEGLVVYGIFSVILGSDTVDSILSEAPNVDSSLKKTLLGIPTNFLLVTEMFFLYRILPKRLKKGGSDGEAGKANS